MKRKQWMLGIICMLLGVIIIMGDPSRTQAASQSDRNAYRAVFDATYYYNAYPDVAAACGTDEEALFNHFVSFGVYEGRSASAAFNPQAYRQRYTDLQEAFGNDMAAYCRHYVTFGRAEGRNAAADGQAAVQINVVIQKKAAPAATDDKTSAKEDTKKSDSKTAQTDKTDRQEETSKNETVKTDKTSQQEETSESKTAQTDKAEDAQTASIQEADAPSVQTGDAAAENVEAEESEQAEQTQAAQTVIGTYTTYYEANVSRAVNVELAAQRINGTVVAPGENFSFSNTILDRTTANGYVEGPIFVKGEKSTGIGGGVCQVSSTLYAAMVDAKLPATERHPHSLPVDYLPAGLDATIAGNYMDLKFTNTFSQPLLIQASAEGGKLVVTLTLQ